MKKKMYLVRVAVLLLAVTLVIPGSVSTVLAAQEGGKLTIITPRVSRITGFPPKISAGAFRQLLPCLEPLFMKNKKGLVEPWLAEGYTVAPDKKSLTITVKKGIKFHDGAVLDAAAVKENLTTISIGGKGRLNLVTSVEVVDDYTVKLNLKQYKSTILRDLTYGRGMMISPKSFKEKGVDWATANPVGTGPFKFAEYKRDVSLKFEKFDGYWQKGKPYLDAIEWKFIVEAMTAKMAFERGDGQIYHYPNPNQVKELKEKGYKGKLEFTGLPAIAGDSGNSDSVYANKKVRMALEYAIDKKALTEAFGYGTYIPITQLSKPGFLGYDPKLERAYNPAMAKKLLAEAGYPKGFKTKMILISGARCPVDIYTAIKAQLSEVGIDCELDYVDTAKHSSYKFKGWKNAILYTGHVQEKENITMMDRFLSIRSRYWPSIERPEGWQKLLDEALQLEDNSSQEKYAKALVKMAYDEVMIIPLWFTAVPVFVTNAVQNDGWNDIDHQWWTPWDCWLSSK